MRPTPPTGMRQTDGTYIVDCLVCKEPLSWQNGYQIPSVQRVYEGAKSALEQGETFLSRVSTPDGDVLLSHWSRERKGVCSGCSLRYWHDFGAGCKFGKWRVFVERSPEQAVLL